MIESRECFMKGSLSNMRLTRKCFASAFIAAAAIIAVSGNAFAGNVIIAPGVVIPGQETSQDAGGQTGSAEAAASETAKGPGESSTTGNSDKSESTDSTAGTDNSKDGSSDSNSSGTASAAGNPTGDGTSSSDSTVSDSQGAQTSDTQPAADDIEALKAQSLKDQYTVLKTSDPNIVVSRGRTIDISKPLIALTYDDGPRTDVGARLMDIFEKYGQRTTFFMVGDRVAARASEVKRMADDGHELANHTYDHVYLNKVGAETIQNQVRACNDIIEQTCGIRPRIMRLPGGNKNSTVLANVNMPIILWNIDTKDWSHRNTQKTIDAVMGKVSDGDIVLMHELYESTAEASEYMVPKLVEQGFQLVTVSELAAIKGRELTANGVYYDIR